MSTHNPNLDDKDPELVPIIIRWVKDKHYTMTIKGICKRRPFGDYDVTELAEFLMLMFHPKTFEGDRASQGDIHQNLFLLEATEKKFKFYSNYFFNMAKFGKE